MTQNLHRCVQNRLHSPWNSYFLWSSLTFSTIALVYFPLPLHCRSNLSLTTAPILAKFPCHCPLSIIHCHRHRHRYRHLPICVTLAFPLSWQQPRFLQHPGLEQRSLSPRQGSSTIEFIPISPATWSRGFRFSLPFPSSLDSTRLEPGLSWTGSHLSEFLLH